LIHDIENEIPDVNFSVSDLLSKSLAKSLAIKNGKKLERQEQEYIVNTLFFCKEPAVSPSNKSIFITIKVDELDKKFN
jgi:DNA mismatch repair protein MutL